MKILIPIIACGLTWSFASAAPTGWSLIKVCQEDLVLHTSDGADAGRVTHLVLDQGGATVSSVLISGGVLAERTVVVPFSSVRVEGSRTTLVEINRERLIAAPVIERSSISTTTTFDTSVVERSRTYFNTSATSTTSTTENARREGGQNRERNRDGDRNRDRDNARDGTRAGERDRERLPDGTADTDRQRRPGEAQSKTEDQLPAGKGRDGDMRRDRDGARGENKAGDQPPSGEARNSERRPDGDASGRGKSTKPEAEERKPGAPQDTPPGSDAQGKDRPNKSPDAATSPSQPGASSNKETPAPQATDKTKESPAPSQATDKEKKDAPSQSSQPAAEEKKKPSPGLPNDQTPRKPNLPDGASPKPGPGNDDAPPSSPKPGPQA